MIHLRPLEERDAPLMLEWMHDVEIQKSFKKKMIDATMNDALAFIRSARPSAFIEDGMNLHFAIANCDDEYCGTISLKNVNNESKNAEYAIVIRKKAQGKGIAFQSTGLILRKAFFEYDLHRVYLNVYSNNERAIRLYEKSGFIYEGEFRDHFFINGHYVSLLWYGMLKQEYHEVRFKI